MERQLCGHLYGYKNVTKSGFSFQLNPSIMGGTRPYAAMGKQHKQWGAFTQADYGYRTVTFPISFSAAYAALNACRKDDRASDWRGILNLTNTSMRVGFENGAYWIAVGK